MLPAAGARTAVTFRGPFATPCIGIASCFHNRMELGGQLDGRIKGAWRALGRLAPERLATLRRAAPIESIGSPTRIEGAKLTDREVERLLSNIEIKAFTSRDEDHFAVLTNKGYLARHGAGRGTWYALS